MAIINTPTNLPYPDRAIEQDPGVTRYLPLPTPTIMRTGTLFGLPLRSFLTNEPVSDDAIQRFITEAVSEVETELGLFLSPVTFSERHDYNREMMTQSWGYFKVNNGPILNVSKFQLTFNNGVAQSPPLVDIPLEFIHVQPQEQTVQLVPAMGMTVSGLIMSVYSGMGFHAFNSQIISNWPGAILIEYRAGFENGKCPAVLAGLTENLAALKMLSTLGPIIFPFNSTSIGIDGTSQSVSTLGPAFLQNRLADLEKIVQSQKEAAKGYFGKRFLIDYL